MSNKVCPKCNEINSGSAMYCVGCQASLSNVQANREDDTVIDRQNQTNRTVYYDNSDVVSIGQWIIIFILLAIPFVNIIMVFVYAFGWDNETINNFGKATLIMILIGIVLAALFTSCGVAMY
ncbi:MAG: zinc finger Ran-binding domain-containing protein [Vallitalea sp.]|jgi:uncharacterized membrane protein YvbJ|nr:zinc finger Ran-binding domain-containing protein [Vallitalea sp.]